MAYEKGDRIILDDRHARSVAKRLNLSMIGTVGVLVQAKQKGIITALKPFIDKLEDNNFYISESLRNGALLLVNE